MSGVLRTRVGYAGGTKKNPTYHDLGDHTESIQIDFDPTRISFQTLLREFWKSHNPYRSCSRQYMSAIFYTNETQKQIAEASYQRQMQEKGTTPETKVLELKDFTLAEDYHQKYYLRHSEFMPLFKPLKNKEFTDSEIAAKVNAFVGGDISRDELTAELALLNVDSHMMSQIEKGSKDYTPNACSVC
eukprot:TRINITY_DN5065_c0_g1_i1.p1 TRINITY_DN5065_c0_g1~~TRINITY_DN5065_c0_g1_i1.p1  ORF type:complete len:187 (+),score=35.07 TRINITY_DN5065_c0_g1_i1:112-672(+)